MIRRHALAMGAIVLSLGSVLQATPAGATVTTYYVSTTGNDTDAGNPNTCTSQATPCATVAHALTQALSGGTIELAAGTYTESNLTILQAVTIEGPAIGGSSASTGPLATIDATGVSGVNSVFNIQPTAASNVYLNYLTIKGGSGSATHPPQVQNVTTYGGGIYNQANSNLTLFRTRVQGNTINGTSSNSGYVDYFAGGGIYNASGASLTLVESTIENNTVTAGATFNPGGTNGNNARGGGVYSEGTLNVLRSTFDGNTATGGQGAAPFPGNPGTPGQGGTGSGGGLDMAGGTASIANSTFNNNTAKGADGAKGAKAFFGAGGAGGNGGNGIGGAINLGTTTSAPSILNTTGAGNTAGAGAAGPGGDTCAGVSCFPATGPSGTAGTGSGGGLAAGTASPHLDNTVLAGNTALAGPDCFGALDPTGAANFVGDTLACTGLPNANGNQLGAGNPMLGSLADNGGPTFTMKPLGGSPLASSGNTTVCANAPVNGHDQRFNTRLASGTCDIGAVEHSGPTAARVTSFTATRHAGVVVLSWYLIDRHGVAGFLLYAGRTRLTAHALAVQHSGRNHFITGSKATTYTLHVLLNGGGQVTVHTH